MTKFQVVVLALGLGLVGLSSPDVASAEDAAKTTRVVATRPQQQVRQDLRQARHRKGVIAEVPELSTGLATQGLALLAGMTLLIHERRRRTA